MDSPELKVILFYMNIRKGDHIGAIVFNGYSSGGYRG